MILIEDIIVSDDVVEKQFVCNLDKCKGACCVEGDFGAPLDENEKAILEENYAKFKPYMSQEGIDTIEDIGLYDYYEEPEEFGTPLNEDGSCAYLYQDKKSGISYCSIEKAWKEGDIEWRKPISCHLYPIRVKSLDTMTALNYDKWEICSAACSLGEELKVRVYEFAKEAIIRRFGEDFYEQLDATAKYQLGENE